METQLLIVVVARFAFEQTKAGETTCVTSDVVRSSVFHNEKIPKRIVSDLFFAKISQTKHLNEVICTC